MHSLGACMQVRLLVRNMVATITAETAETVPIDNQVDAASDTFTQSGLLAGTSHEHPMTLVHSRTTDTGTAAQ